MTRATLFFVGACVAACKFPELPPVETDAANADASTTSDASPDASPPCVPDSIVCDDANSIYVDCSSNGTIEFQMTCPLGCASGQEKCVDIDPSNDVAMYLDMARDRSDVPAITFTNMSTINADGMVFNGGSSITVPSSPVTGARVFMFKQLTIPAGAVLKGGGGASLILVSDGPVRIDGLLDVSADGSISGPQSGSPAACSGPTVGTAAGVPAPGAGGAAGISNGAAGGSSGANPGGAGGVIDSSSSAVPLVGGCGGGVSSQGAIFSFGGGGGGAVQIVSRVSITLSLSGAIDAGGGGGLDGPSTANVGGGGGGSGGVVFLEAPQVILDGPSVVIAAKGGGGAAAGMGQLSTNSGSDGGTAAAPAAGGTNSGFASGGLGGTVNGGTVVFPTVGGNGGSQPGAGGGGAAGRAFFHTSSGTINPQNGAAIRAGVGTNTIRTRLVP